VTGIIVALPLLLRHLIPSLHEGLSPIDAYPIPRGCCMRWSGVAIPWVLADMECHCSKLDLRDVIYVNLANGPEVGGGGGHYVIGVEREGVAASQDWRQHPGC